MACLALATACSGSALPLSTSDDLGGGAPDLSATTPDLAELPDLATVDLGSDIDLAPVLDLALPPDLAELPGQCPNAAGLQAGAPWAVAGGCPTRRGRSPHLGPPGKHVKFKVDVGPEDRIGPATVARDGSVFFASRTNVWAIDGTTGKSSWRVPGNGGESGSAVSADGTVFLGVPLAARDGKTGAAIWTSMVYEFQSPVVAPGGTVYLAGGFLFAINPMTGDIVATQDNQESFTAVALAPNGQVIVGGYLGIASYDAGLVLRWSYPTRGNSTGRVAVSDSGVIYAGSNQGTAYALDAAGGLRWSTALGAECLITPSIGAGKLVYFPCSDGTVHALDAATGAPAWTFPTDGAPNQPTLDANDTLYVTSAGGLLYAVDGTTGALLWSLATGGRIWAAPALGANRVLY